MKRITIVLIVALALVSTAPVAEAGIFSKKAECGFKVVSYQITGPAGASFRYAGKSFEIPAHGTIEVLATRSDRVLSLADATIDLAGSEPDVMGIVQVDLSEARSRSAAAAARVSLASR